MTTRAFFLHMRWFCLFTFVAISSTLFSSIQGGLGRLANLQFWIELWPTLATCAALSIVVPWAVFLIDPRRTDAPSLGGMLRYWKAI